MQICDLIINITIIWRLLFAPCIRLSERQLFVITCSSKGRFLKHTIFKWKKILNANIIKRIRYKKKLIDKTIEKLLDFSNWIMLQLLTYALNNSIEL